MLPLEIFDTILDDVHELDSATLDLFNTSVADTFPNPFPKKTLPICALVCKSWLSRARHLGFREVLLPNGDANVGVTLCTLLDHPLCTFRPYVRTLKLRAPLYGYSSESMRRDWLRTVLSRLATLPNVECLHLVGMRLPEVAETDWVDMVLPLFGPHLKRLMIFSTYFTRPSDVTELVSRCTQLEVLKLGTLTMADRYSEQDVTAYPRPSQELREVSFLGEVAMDVIHWLISAASSTSPPPLSTISFEDITSPSCILVARCLDVFGSSITSLTLGLIEDGTYSETEDLLCKHVNPSSLTHLRTIQFGPLGFTPWTPDIAPARHIASILSKIGSRDVEEILFEPICCLSVQDMSLMDWDAIVSILNSPTYSKLEVLRLSFWEQVELCKEAEIWLQPVRAKLRARVEVTPQ